MRDLLYLRGKTVRRIYLVAIAVGLGIAVALGSTTAVLINWNYSGYERKAPWGGLQGHARFLGNTPTRTSDGSTSPRSTSSTPCIFELIPIGLTNRPWKGPCGEFLHRPLPLREPSELSPQPSHAIGSVQYPPRNTVDGVTHLQFMNIPYMIAVSPK